MSTGGGILLPSTGALSIADVGLPTLDMDPNTLAGAEGDRIASFPNRSDLPASTFVQALSGSRPKLKLNILNGLKALNFDANYCLEGPSTENLQRSTIIAVVQRSVTNGGMILGPYTNPFAGGPGLGVTNANPMSLRVLGQGGTMGSSPASFSNGTWALVGASISFSRIHFRINGTGTFGTTTAANFSLPDRLVIGDSRNAAAGAQDPWRGYIGRILMWTRVLEDWEWLLWDRYLNTLYNLGLTLTTWS